MEPGGKTLENDVVVLYTHLLYRVHTLAACTVLDTGKCTDFAWKVLYFTSGIGFQRSGLLYRVGQSIPYYGNEYGIPDDAFAADPADGGSNHAAGVGVCTDSAGDGGDGGGVYRLYDDAVEGFFEFQRQRLFQQ